MSKLTTIDEMVSKIKNKTRKKKQIRPKEFYEKEKEKRKKNCKELHDTYIKKQLATVHVYQPPQEIIEAVRAVMQLKREIKRIRAPELMLANLHRKKDPAVRKSKSRASSNVKNPSVATDAATKEKKPDLKNTEMDL